jgi:acetyl-CoA carboxylase carboxyltransferase component
VTSLALGARRGGAVSAELRAVDGRMVSWFRLEGGKHHGALGPVEGEAIAVAIDMARDLGIPLVGVVDTSGADVHEGVAALHAWGGVARSLSDASGVVPTILVVVGASLSGPALLLGIADVVVMTSDAFAYVTGPATVTAFTGVDISHEELGGAPVHRSRTGVAALAVDDEDEAMAAVADLLAYLPANNLEEPPAHEWYDAIDRPTDVAASLVPTEATASYDVRQVLADVVDEDTLIELRAGYARSLVTALARVGGRPVGIVASQPPPMAGTLDIDASQKGARFVQWCDAFNLPLLTFVDTPGFLPGKDLEWQGMIRHGAQLAHAYAAATVPRVCVILRKAYGGAFIVMDCKTMGNDYCVAWPQAEVAVMGAPGAVAILRRRELAAAGDDAAARAGLQAELEDEYRERYCTPTVAAERGYVDDVIDPRDTRRVVATALAALRSKREHLPHRRHANTPL